MDRITAQHESEVIIKAIIKLSEKWSLSDEEAAGLLNVTSESLALMRTGEFEGMLNEEQTARASLLIGIYERLRLLFSGPLTYGWPKMANAGAGYHGQSPVAIMLGGGIPAIMRISDHIEAMRHGH
ncbi:hypothetical protein [Allohahella marinimesophila]|uniref:Antitoxin Xre/MbcA/ParS-like toxin-binding domain-containing protein n=1 Tax=Allohahella marinimesophila TaxID=1054972 RepID=A0ABP7Q7M7_9GAMM